MKKNILILFGGKSCEHDISIVSAFQCLKSMDEYLYNAYCVYIDKNGVWRYFKKTNFKDFVDNRNTFKKCQLGVNEKVLYEYKHGKYKRIVDIDVVVPIMHGINGEDGCIAGMLNMCNIPYVGCDNISSSVGIDKSLFKKICNNLPLLRYYICDADDVMYGEKLVKNISNNIGFPCIIKPCRQGSSIGINICKNEENLVNLVKKSLNFDKKVIIEQFVGNMREFNVAIFSCAGEMIVSEIEEPILTQNILTFEDKYLNFSGGNIAKKIPAKISAGLKNKIIQLAKLCYVECGFSGVVRIDFIYDKDAKKLYINEVNTIPGSLGLYLYEGAGIDRGEVLNKLISEAIRIHNEDEKYTNNFKSNVLNGENLNKFNK